MNIVQLQNNLKDLSDRQLLETMQGGSAPQYLVLSEMQRRKKMREEVASKPQQPSSVAEDTMQGLASLPQVPTMQMYGGGIVGFAGGKRVSGQAKGEAEACWTDPSSGKSMCPPDQAKMVGKKFAGGKAVASDEANYLMQLLQSERGGLPFSPEEISRLVELSNQQSVDLGKAKYADKTISKDPAAKAQAMKGEGGYSYDKDSNTYYGTEDQRLLTKNLPAITGEVGSDEYLNSIRTKYAPLFRDAPETDTSKNGHSGKMEDYTSPVYPIKRQAQEKPKFDASMPTDGIPLAAGLFGPTERGPERRNPQEQNVPFGSGGQMMSSGLENLIRAITGPNEEDFYLPQQPIISDIRGDNRREFNTPVMDEGLDALAAKMGVARDSELTVPEPSQAPVVEKQVAKPAPKASADQSYDAMTGADSKMESPYLWNAQKAEDPAEKARLMEIHNNWVDSVDVPGATGWRYSPKGGYYFNPQGNMASPPVGEFKGTTQKRFEAKANSELGQKQAADAASADEKINKFLAEQKPTGEAKSKDPLSELYDEIKADRAKKYEPNMNEFLMRAGLAAAASGGKQGDFMTAIAQGGLEGLDYLAQEKAADRKRQQENLSDMVKLIGSRELSAAKAVTAQQAQAKSYLDNIKLIADQLESGTMFTSPAEIEAAKKRIQELYRAYNATMGLPMAATTGTDPSAFKTIQ